MHKETMKYLMKLIHDECGGDKTCVDALWDEIHSETIKEEETFSTDKTEAYNKMKGILESDDKYKLVGKSWEGSTKVEYSYFEVTNKKDKKKVITLENNDTHPACIITSLDSKKREYSQEGMEEIDKWENYGRGGKRKRLNYSGKNIKETMSMIDKILS
tara:strand:+ start:548 stop:1024 length:477 start_codon:yes stop_codon:yes gene_type:complete